MTFPFLGSLGPVAMMGSVSASPPVDMGSGTEYAASANATTYTFAHTVPAGTTCLVVFASAPVGAGGRAIVSVEFGGVAMTQGAGIDYSGSGQVMIYAYYLLNPTPSTANVVTTYDGTTTSFAGWAKNFNNVNLSAPIAASATDNHATGTNLSPNISPAVPSALLGVHLRYNTAVVTFTPSADATEISEITSTGGASSRHNLLMKSQDNGGTFDFGSTASSAATTSAFCSIALAGA